MEVYANAFMATPRVAFIPLIIVLLGLGFKAKIAVVFLGAVMPILINTYAGVLNADGELVEMARSAGANRRQIFRRILLPGALPFIVVGLRLGATIGLINTIVAELYTAISGLGGLLAFYGNTFQMGKYFVVIITLALVGVTITQLIRLLETRMDRWRYNAAG
jgi:NitT/TauT family transport system permease protein